MAIFKKGDKVTISDGMYYAIGIVHSTNLNTQRPYYLIKLKGGKLMGALAKDVKKMF